MTLSFPANFQAGPGHNWANAIAMATPIAHKGVIAGAKVQAMTTLDLLMRPEIVTQAWEYFRTVQTKNVTYTPLIRPEDTPAIWLNEETMAKYRPELRKYYYDPTKYKTYLDQLGISTPRFASGGEMGSVWLGMVTQSDSRRRSAHSDPRSGSTPWKNGLSTSLHYPRSSVSCAAVTLRARFTPLRVCHGAHSRALRTHAAALVRAS